MAGRKDTSKGGKIKMQSEKVGERERHVEDEADKGVYRFRKYKDDRIRQAGRQVG